VRPHSLATIRNQVNIKGRRVENGLGRYHTKVKPKQTALLATADKIRAKDPRSTVDETRIKGLRSAAV
jgi:hypothetical protein